MAITTPKALYRGATSTSPTTLYTAPASTTAVVTSIVVCNPTIYSQTFNIELNGTSLLASSSIAANTTAVFDLKQVISSGQTISGFSSAFSITYHISGVEIA
jgi:hypothetical protein